MVRGDEETIKALIIANNVMIVIILVSSVFAIYQNGRIFRYITAIIWLYCFRFFFSLIFKLPYPTGYSWSYPGVPQVINKLIIKGFFFSI